MDIAVYVDTGAGSSARGVDGECCDRRGCPVHRAWFSCRCHPDGEDTEGRFSKHGQVYRFAHQACSHLTANPAQDTIVQNESPSLDFLVCKAGLLCLGLSNWCARKFAGFYVSKQQVHASNWPAAHRDGVSAGHGAPKEGGPAMPASWIALGAHEARRLVPPGFTH